VNGEEALQILEKESVHVIVSDIMMPVMDGFELCKRVKSSLHHCHIPVILLTAKKTLEAKIDGLELGADAYVEKPFSPKYLQAQIANLLANRNKLKDFFASSPLVHMKSMAYSKADEEFLEKLNEFINENLKNQNLDVEQLARAMNMSRPTFYRKIKGVSDLSPNELINISRLKKAAELLVEGKYKIYEISDFVGFTSQHHFARSFLKQFGIPPSEYQAISKQMPAITSQ
jgi:YesN/AraC family two-component response regulator